MHFNISCAFIKMVLFIETASKGCSISRLVLFNKMRESGQKDLANQISYLKTYLIEKTCCPSDRLDELHRTILFFTSDFKRKWNESNRTYDRFMGKNKAWLETSVNFPNFQNVSRKKSGRPRKSFAECTDRSKRMKTEELRSKYSSNELAYAAEVSMRAEGSLAAAKIIRNISFSSSTDRNNLSKDYGTEHQSLTGDQALSMLSRPN